MPWLRFASLLDTAGVWYGEEVLVELRAFGLTSQLHVHHSILKFRNGVLRLAHPEVIAELVVTLVSHLEVCIYWFQRGIMSGITFAA